MFLLLIDIVNLSKESKASLQHIYRENIATIQDLQESEETPMTQMDIDVLEYENKCIQILIKKGNNATIKDFDFLINK